MKVTCTGRRVNLKPSFVEKAEEKLSRLDKFFSDDVQAQVTVTVEKSRQTVEITLRDKGFTVRAEKAADRMEDALEDATELLMRRVVKNRKRLGDRVTRSVEWPVYEEPELTAPEEAYQIIREKRFAMKPCSTDEAILQMELLGHSFYMYHSTEHDQVQVVYRRADGGYGVLIPEL